MDSKLKVKAHTCFLGQTGYANHSRNFFSELSKLCDLKIRNSTVDDNKNQYFTEKQKNLIIEQSYFDEEGKFATYPPEGKREIEGFEQDIDIVLETNQHYYFYDNYKPKTSIAYLVWESTRLQEHFFNHLRRNFDYFWCPSTWQRDCMVEQGWPEDKIFVVPEGVDPELKPANNLKHLLNKEKFQFFLAGRWDYRKSTTEIIRAFLEEFKNDKNVELLCSIDNPFAKDNLTTEQRLIEHNLISDKIKIIHFPKRQDYIRYMQYCHCHISCSRSEGWGLPISDSIACGTPTIYAHNTAPIDFASEIGIPVKTKEMRQAKDCVFLDGVEGEYPEPDFDHLKKQMRYAFNNFKELKEKALAYAPKFAEKYKWEKQAELAHSILKKIKAKKNKKNISKSSGPKKIAWVVSFTKDYEFYADNLIPLLTLYSKFDILPYSVNFNKERCKRIDVDLSEGKDNYWENLKYKNFNKYYSKFYAAIDSCSLDYDGYIFIDVDMFPVGNIDSISAYFENIENFPLFSRYFYEFINSYTIYKGKMTEGHYGKEIEQILDTKRNLPNILSTGLFIYNNDCKWFFQKCISEYNNCKKIDLLSFSDDNALSEERMVNGLSWKLNNMKSLPITWKNKSHNYQGEYEGATTLGFDVFYNIDNNRPLFLHGPDPSINKKNKQSLDKLYNYLDDNINLMIVAHLDDEVIFGGNSIIDGDWHIVVVVAPTQKRIDDFNNVVKLCPNIRNVSFIQFEDSFYKNLDKNKLIEELRPIIQKNKWKKIVTHNPIGEYGHLHHRDVFEAVLELTDGNFYVFCKDKAFQNKRQDLIECYRSEQEIINQLKNCKNGWFESNNLSTNYIDNSGITKYDKNKDISEFVPCYEKGNIKSPNVKFKKCFFITSHCDDDIKMDELRGCLKRLKKYKKDYDILIYSSLPIPDDIQSHVDGLYYSRYNPVLSVEERTIIFFSYIHGVKLSSYQIDYGTAAITQFKNCFLISSALNYDSCTVINYDSVFDDIFLSKHEERVCKDCDAVYYLRKEGFMNLLLFTVKNNHNTLKAFENISIKEYRDINANVAESYMSDQVLNKLNCLVIENHAYHDNKTDKPNRLYDNIDYHHHRDNIKRAHTDNFGFNFSIDARDRNKENSKLIACAFKKEKKQDRLEVVIDGVKVFDGVLEDDLIVQTDLIKKYVSNIKIIDNNKEFNFSQEEFGTHDFLELDEELEEKLKKEGKIIKQQSKKQILINCESSALGDNIAWMPYVDEYASENKNYQIHYKTNLSSLFEKEYANIKFINEKMPPSTYEKEIFLGLLLDDPKGYHKNHYTDIPLQQVASDILNLQYEEKKTKIHIKNKANNFNKKYVCISVQSTCQAKLWTQNGWNKLVNYIKSLGYEVVCIDKYKQFGIEGHMNTIPDNCLDKTGNIDLNDRITDIYNCEFFIGLSSGLSWLAWALGKPVVMISGFTDPKNEFYTPYRVINKEVCNSCWNDKTCKFDRSDWLWCPRGKNFECSNSISFEMVKEKVDQLVKDKENHSERFIFSTPNGTKDYSEHDFNSTMTDIGIKYGWDAAAYAESFIANDYSKKFNIEKGDTVLDVGANIGFFSRYAAINGASKIYSIEPSKQYFNHLKENLKKYSFAKTFNLAISNKNGKAQFLESEHFGGDSVVDGAGDYKVNSLTFDSFLERNKIDHIDFLKVDIEGSELDLFECFPDAKLNNVKKIVIEYHHRLFNYNADIRESFIDRFRKLGFNLYVLYTSTDDLQLIYFWK